MPTSIFPIALATLVAVYNVAQVSCGDQCFNIAEIQQSEYFPCNPSSPTSSCCQSGWICLSNGLCEPANNPHGNPVTWTGFCTDPLWENTTVCPKVCQNNLTATGVDNRVSSCGNGHFCCYVDNNSTECCSTSSNVFSLGVATIVTTIANSTPAATSSKTSANSGSVSIPAMTIQGSSPSVTNTPTTSDSDSHVAVGVGAGVGIPVGLAILAGFFYLVRRRSKTRSERRLERHPEAKDKNDNRLPVPLAKGCELPAESPPGELSDPQGPRVELEIHVRRAELAESCGLNPET